MFDLRGLLGLVIFILDIIAIVDILKSSMTTGMKALWAILVIVFPVVGLILYYLFGKKS